MMLEKTKIYGVDFIFGDNPVRTDDAVGLSYSTGLKNPSLLLGEIKSDFDHCYPWSDITAVSDELGNIFMRIPKFYAKVAKNAYGDYKIQISGCRYEGFSTLHIDGKGNELDYVLVGKYEGSGSSSRICSKSGQTVLTNITCDAFRTACRANGEGYQLYDILIDSMLKLLFMVEFATAKSIYVMDGWGDSTSSAALLTGHTDLFRTASCGLGFNYTGSPIACMYRGVENWIGNYREFCDGLYAKSKSVTICTDPTCYHLYAEGSSYRHAWVPFEATSLIVSLKPLEGFPLIFIPKEVDPIPVKNPISKYFGTFGAPQSQGGFWSFTESWWNGCKQLWNYNPETYSKYTGGRLCFKPIGGI